MILFFYSFSFFMQTSRMVSRKHLRGFSLAEVLIAIVIIAILTIGSLAVYSSQIAKARDTERRNDVTRIKGLLDTVIGEYGSPPGDQVKSRKLRNVSGCNATNDLLKCFNSLQLSTEDDLDQLFLDPSQGIVNDRSGGTETYGYLYASNENSYKICAMFENQGAPDLNFDYSGTESKDLNAYNNLFCIEHKAIGGEDAGEVAPLTPPEE
jgi:prepilin-type N-terminal cleavage/methylation domain-containing protein